MFPSNRSLRGYSFADTAGGYPLVGGMGGVAPTGFVGSTAVKARDVSYDTSSKDPQMMRARVFVGNMNTNVITRDDIIRLFSAYGHLLGVTVFKGYAFIQYGNATDADLAVSTLNGYNWNGSILDVKLAIAGMKPQNLPPSLASANGTKRVAETLPAPTEVKRERLDSNPKVKEQNVENKKAMSTDKTSNRNLYQHGMADTLICGGCRFVTSDFEQFREHRLLACSKGDDNGSVGEAELPCSMCDETCSNGDELIKHALERHNIRLVKFNAE